MRRSFLVAAGVASLVLTAVCPTASAGRTSSARTVVKVAFNKKLKKSILVDGRGLTLYAYTADPRGVAPSCVNDATYHCSKVWPPLRSGGAPRAGPGIRASLLGTTKRSDGAPQVTYNGYPLYTNAGAAGFGLVRDGKPGDVHGQTFAGAWYVVSPKGKPIMH